MSEFLGTVVEARELEVDQLLQRRTESLIGNLAIAYEIQIDPTNEFDIESNIPSNLAEALELSRNGNAQAREMVRNNVVTDYFERAYKSGFVSEVGLSRRDDGEIEQYGQSIEDVHLNSLKFISNQKLKERAKIEALNSVRDKYYANSGMLVDSARITFSLVHDGMNDNEAEEAGFFVQTRSISIQVMTEKEDGDLVVQTAFVAGRENLGSAAFDKEAIIKLAEKFGIDYSGNSSEDILSRPFLVSRSLVPDLAVSVARIFDDSAFEVTGRRKFFGLDTKIIPTESDYKLKKDQSKKLIEDISEDIDFVVDKLVKFEAKTPIDATFKLAEYNDQLLKNKIVLDERIDSRVLGRKASYYIEHARAIIRNSEIINLPLQRDLMIIQQKINQTGNSASCPTGISKSGAEGDFFDLNGQEDDNVNDELIPDDCEFVSKQCPKCGEKNVKTECKKGKYYGACGCVSD